MKQFEAAAADGDGSRRDSCAWLETSARDQAEQDGDSHVVVSYK